jgi:P27 family predicted phage terminase small subunit
MGRRGPAPHPTALKLLHGEQRASRINANEPRPRIAAPEAPAWLSERAAQEWERIVPELTAMGTARASDSVALAAYCEAVARLAAAVQVVAQAGMLIRDAGGGVRKNPAVAQARDASNDVRQWAREFGLTPSARSPLRVEHSSSTSGGAERLLS